MVIPSVSLLLFLKGHESSRLKEIKYWDLRPRRHLGTHGLHLPAVRGIYFLMVL